MCPSGGHKCSQWSTDKGWSAKGKAHANNIKNNESNENKLNTMHGQPQTKNIVV